jgi:hypothetical protein
VYLELGEEVLEFLNQRSLACAVRTLDNNAHRIIIS